MMASTKTIAAYICSYMKHIVGTVPTIISGKTSNNQTTEDNTPMETQNAQCTIKAGNIEASAQASVSKKLEGICGTSKYELLYLFVPKVCHNHCKNILDQMKESFEIIEARLMYEINQLKAMIYVLLPNKPANYQYNGYTYASPYNQPMFHQSIYPTNANNYEQTTQQTTHHGTQHSNQPVSDNFQQTNIPQIPYPTSTSLPFKIRITPTSVIEKPTTASTTTTESGSKHIPELKASTVVKEKILEFKPVQTKSLNRFRSKNHK